jgi:hypothetical protein
VKWRHGGAAGSGYPPPRLLAFDADDWPDGGPVQPVTALPRSPAMVLPMPPRLAREMGAWRAWCRARHEWSQAHPDAWPTGEIERWVEERAARPGRGPR